MARPTNVEPKDGEAGQERGENASVQIEDQQKSPGSETSGKDAGKGPSHIPGIRVHVPVTGTPGKEHINNGFKSGDVQEESTSLTKGMRPGPVPLCQ